MGGKLTGRRARYAFVAIAALAPLLYAPITYAADATPQVVGADVAWLLTSSALVPGQEVVVPTT